MNYVSNLVADLPTQALDEQKEDEEEAPAEEAAATDEVDEAVAAAPESKDGKVRFQAKNWAITYPNMPESSTKEMVMNQLKTKFGAKAKYIRVCREVHQSGKPHYHCFIGFTAKCNYKDSRWADINIDGVRHPNIKVCYQPDGWIIYMLKSDKEHLEYGVDSYSASSKTVWKDVLTDLTMTDKERFDMLIKAGKGRDVALNADRISRSVQILKKAKNTSNTYERSSLYRLETLVPTVIKWWLENEFIKLERAKTLIVVGSTRLGKTALFRSLFPQAIFWRNAVNLDTFDENAPIIIMDDIYWDYIPNKKTYLTHMGHATVTAKYRQMTDINVKMPCVVLLNEMPVFTQEARYWKENTYIVQLGEHKLYGELQPGFTLDNMAKVIDYDLSITHVSNDVNFP